MVMVMVVYYMVYGDNVSDGGNVDDNDCDGVSAEGLR